ncbi:hypothetical protein ABIF38_005543 [Bradyrhizobium japonicum]|nr:hypothetical protein [Bradyrhizobium elkanii]MCS3567481.1 hypothetical protein [Bradyrhizobium elkanii]MCS3591034.1 hypothetical protein [Bradyrhizobium elkanii]MCS3620477.1 hypothetical protein [Bradyrhizobium elkanii]MCW2111350.1 hypothetical protein [Bradyrhizobium elkanii]
MEIANCNRIAKNNRIATGIGPTQLTSLSSPSSMRPDHGD